jgi:methionyl aminopeptidase
VAIQLKTKADIEKLRAAGQVVREVLNRLGEMVLPGVTTEELDAEAERLCRAHGAKCLFKGVPGPKGPFPGNICSSINDEVVHGIPSSDRVIRDGEIVSVDFGVRLDGWCGDAAETYSCGQIDPRWAHLVAVTRQSLELAVSMAKPGLRWSQVAGAMQEYVEGEGLSVVREFVGHGIGREMHEDPKVPNYAGRGTGGMDFDLCEGMVLAVEPMVNLGSQAVKVMQDGWTVCTQDGEPSAHFEHMLALTSDGVDVLTV